MDDIQYDDQNRFSNNMGNLGIFFYDEHNEDEDYYNTTLVGWSSKNNIKYWQENMNIGKDALNEIDDNVNDDF